MYIYIYIYIYILERERERERERIYTCIYMVNFKKPLITILTKMLGNHFCFRQASVGASDTFRLRSVLSKTEQRIISEAIRNPKPPRVKLQTPALPVARYHFEQGKKCPKVVRSLSEACPKGRASSKPRGALVDIFRTCQSLSLSAW